MAGRRARRKSKFVSVTRMDKDEKLAEAKGVTLHVESNCRRALLDDDMNDIGNMPSGSSTATPDEQVIHDGLVYQVCISVAIERLGIESMPNCSEIEESIAMTFRRKFEGCKSKFTKK